MPRGEVTSEECLHYAPSSCASPFVPDIHSTRGREIRPLVFLMRGCYSLGRQLASGLGRIWIFTALLSVPGPPSVCHRRSGEYTAQIARPFQPPFGSSMRPSSPLV